MKATDFEYRHQKLIHQCIVASAFLTYLIQRDDIVWQLVRNSASPHTLERSLFLFATLLIAAGAIIATSARVYPKPTSSTGVGPYRYLRHPLYFGELLYAVGLASLAPISGFVILVVGESLRVIRLMRREDDSPPQLQHPPSTMSPSSSPGRGLSPRWREAFRQEAVKWGLVLTMIVFVITLRDRLAEILAAASFLVGLLLSHPTITAYRSSSPL
jgi:hypothetical protein